MPPNTGLVEMVPWIRRYGGVEKADRKQYGSLIATEDESPGKQRAGASSSGSNVNGDDTEQVLQEHHLSKINSGIPELGSDQKILQRSCAFHSSLADVLISSSWPRFWAWERKSTRTSWCKLTQAARNVVSIVMRTIENVYFALVGMKIHICFKFVYTNFLVQAAHIHVLAIMVIVWNNRLTNNVHRHQVIVSVVIAMTRNLSLPRGFYRNWRVMTFKSCVHHVSIDICAYAYRQHVMICHIHLAWSTTSGTSTRPEGIEANQDCTVLWFKKLMLGFEMMKFSKQVH